MAYGCVSKCVSRWPSGAAGMTRFISTMRHDLAYASGRQYSYDSACEELAEHFLTGSPQARLPEAKEELAQDIQDAVESWFADHE